MTLSVPANISTARSNMFFDTFHVLRANIDHYNTNSAILTLCLKEQMKMFHFAARKRKGHVSNKEHLKCSTTMVVIWLFSFAGMDEAQ